MCHWYLKNTEKIDWITTWKTFTYYSKCTIDIFTTIFLWNITEYIILHVSETLILEIWHEIFTFILHYVYILSFKFLSCLTMSYLYSLHGNNFSLMFSCIILPEKGFYFIRSIKKCLKISFELLMEPKYRRFST